MTNYAPANRAAAWYQDNYPGSDMDPNCGVIHTTEGTSLPGYGGGATAPTYTAVPDFDQKRLRWFAHYPDEKSSRALVNAPGGVETNTANAIQVELVGTCAPGTHAAWTKAGARHIYWPEAPDWAMRDLARFLADMNLRHGIPLDGPADRRWKAYPESYGAGGQRFTQDEWRNFTGWCGHQHVPENVHGDPGDFPWSIVVGMAREMIAARAQARQDATNTHKDPLETPQWDSIAATAARIVKHAKPGTKRHDDAKTILDLAKAHSEKF